MKFQTIIAVFAIAVVSGLAGMSAVVAPAEAAAPTCAGVPHHIAGLAAKTYYSPVRGNVVSSRWNNVSYAKGYRTEATSVDGTGRSRSTTSYGWMGGGKRGSTVYRVGKKDHHVRVLALDRNGNAVACAVVDAPMTQNLP